MKRKATLDPLIQADAKAAFRQLQLQINGLARDRAPFVTDWMITPQPQSSLMCWSPKPSNCAVNWSDGATSSAATTRCG
jgi:hypothetical protein